MGTSLYGGQRVWSGGEVETWSEDITGTRHEFKYSMAKFYLALS